MPPYKRQHYLPAGYLKNFSIDQTKCNRESWIWRFNATRVQAVPVVSQCSADYHYSRTQPEQTEAMFHKLEQRYCHCIDALKSGKNLSTQQYGDLLVTMFDLHLRNAAHLNRTGKEGIAAYNTRSRVFLNEILLGRSGSAVTREEIAVHIETHWHLRILLSSPNSIFMTSDHPSAWISLKARQTALHMVLLPLTPTYIAVAFDKRFVKIVDKLVTHDDMFTLNATQIENSVQNVYASVHLPEQELALVKKQLAGKPQESPCEVSENTWKLRLQGLSPENHFSFLRLIPPLF